MDGESFIETLIKSGHSEGKFKQRALKRSLERGRYSNDLSRGASFMINQLANKEKLENLREAYKLKMKNLKDLRKRY